MFYILSYNCFRNDGFKMAKRSFTTALKMTNTYFKGTLKGTQFHSESSHAFSCEAYT